jgi:hypothetical protein
LGARDVEVYCVSVRGTHIAYFERLLPSGSDKRRPRAGAKTIKRIPGTAANEVNFKGTSRLHVTAIAGAHSNSRPTAEVRMVIHF